jgi:hypothetical protein
MPVIPSYDIAAVRRRIPSPGAAESLEQLLPSLADGYHQGGFKQDIPAIVAMARNVGALAYVVRAALDFLQDVGLEDLAP